MIWNIGTNQNSIKSLNYLAARKRYFQTCNMLVVVSFIIPLFTSIGAFALLGAVGEATAYLALFSLIYSIIEVGYIEPKLSTTSVQCAGLVEAFDCEVFDLSKNPNFGSSFSSAHISEAASKLSSPEMAKLRDWYNAELGLLPRPVAAMIAQYTSTAYDQSLRKSYLNILKTCLILLCTALIIFMLLQNLKIRESLITSIVPFLPLLLWFIKAITGTSNLIADQNTALNALDQQWALVKSGRLMGRALEEVVRDNQDGLYLRRTNSSLIFPKLYSILRPRLEGRANRTAAQFIEEYGS